MHVCPICNEYINDAELHQIGNIIIHESCCMYTVCTQCNETIIDLDELLLYIQDGINVDFTHVSPCCANNTMTIDLNRERYCEGCKQTSYLEPGSTIFPCGHITCTNCTEYTTCPQCLDFSRLQI